jgi:hypothetical protein
VRSLVEGGLGGGEHLARWDGTLADGDRAPAGVYFVTLRTATALRTQRMVLAR